MSSALYNLQLFLDRTWRECSSVKTIHRDLHEVAFTAAPKWAHISAMQGAQQTQNIVVYDGFRKKFWTKESLDIVIWKQWINGFNVDFGLSIFYVLRQKIE